MSSLNVRSLPVAYEILPGHFLAYAWLVKPAFLKNRHRKVLYKAVAIQMDRLCAYDFQDEGMVIAVEFLKYLFNRIDFVYHCEESGISKPVREDAFLTLQEFRFF